MQLSCVWLQNSSRKRACLVKTGLDAEETLWLHEDDHQQKGPAQVCLYRTCWGPLASRITFVISMSWFLFSPPKPARNTHLSERRYFNHLLWQWILWAKRVDDGGGGSRHRWAARWTKCHRCQSVHEGRGLGLSGNSAFTLTLSKTPKSNLPELHN